MKTIDFNDLKADLLRDPQVRAAYDALEEDFAIAGELIAARSRAGLSQDEVAARMGTRRLTIARLESGNTLPSLRTLSRYAAAIGARVEVRLIQQPGA